MTEEQALDLLARHFCAVPRATPQPFDASLVRVIKDAFESLAYHWSKAETIPKYGAFVVSCFDGFISEPKGNVSNVNYYEELLLAFQDSVQQGIFPKDEASDDISIVLHLPDIMHQWPKMLPDLASLTTEEGAVTVITIQLGGIGLATAICSWAALRTQFDNIERALKVIHIALDVLEHEWSRRSSLPKLPTYYMVQVKDIFMSCYMAYAKFPQLQLELIRIARDLHEHVQRCFKV